MGISLIMKLLLIPLLAIIVIGVKKILEKPEELEENDNNLINNNMNAENQIVTGTNNKSNKVVNVTLKGGLIGMLADSPQKTLNRTIKKENENGWKVVQVIPSSSGNILLLIFRIILLIITVFLFTTSNGYYVIMEKK